MRGGRKDVLREVLLAGAHCGNTAATAALCAVNRGRLALDIAEVGEGVRAVLLLDEVLNVDLVSHILNARMALVAVFLLDLLQLLLNNSKNIRIARQNFLKACNAALEVLVLVVDLLLLQTGQAAQTHIYDGLRLRLVEVELEMLRAVHDAEQRNLVILESTVPPHTSEMLARVLSEESGIPMNEIHVAHCPERVIPGNMMYELKNNDRIVGARTPEAAEMAASIYEKVLEKGVVHKTDDLTAEMCKLTENTFRDVNIAYANELSVICDKMGIDVFELIKLANCHPRVNILTPGVGVGGHCIAVDPWFIYEQFPAEAKVILAARERNENKPHFVADKVVAKMKKVTDTVGVLGLSYKPDVDDLRESPSIELCHILQEKGVKVIACEPFAKDTEVQNIPNVSFEEVLKADYLVITLGHTLFKENKDKIAEKPYFDCVGMME